MSFGYPVFPPLCYNGFLMCSRSILNFLPGVCLFLFLAGCCQKQTSSHGSIGVPKAEFSETPTEKLVPVEKDELKASTPSTFGEKWEDFRRRLRHSSPRDLTFYAEELFDLAPSEARKKRLELSFFLMQVYKQRGDLGKSGEYGAHYRRILKAITGGSGFQEHTDAKKNSHDWGKLWGYEDQE
jgi:hypothetical protein